LHPRTAPDPPGQPAFHWDAHANAVERDVDGRDVALGPEGIGRVVERDAEVI
jgi:hypothetical protein